MQLNPQQVLNNPQNMPLNQPQNIPLNQPQNMPLNQPQNMPLNQPQNPPQFFGVFPNQMMQPMTPEQQKMQLEIMKKEAFQKGVILKKQKEAMELIMKNRAKREEERKTAELVLFFKYKDDILPITVTADKMIPELLQLYIEQSGNQNVKFKFKGQELKIDDSSGRSLYEIERLRTGEEIIVEDRT